MPIILPITPISTTRPVPTIHHLSELASCRHSLRIRRRLCVNPETSSRSRATPSESRSILPSIRVKRVCVRASAAASFASNSSQEFGSAMLASPCFFSVWSIPNSSSSTEDVKTSFLSGQLGADPPPSNRPRMISPIIPSLRDHASHTFQPVYYSLDVYDMRSDLKSKCLRIVEPKDVSVVNFKKSARTNIVYGYAFCLTCCVPVFILSNQIVKYNNNIRESR